MTEEPAYDAELDDPDDDTTGHEDDTDALGDAGEDDNTIVFEPFEDDEDVDSAEDAEEGYPV